MKSHAEALSKVLGWTWTKVQQSILDNLTRFILISGGDRGGKSFFLSAWLLFQMIEDLIRLKLGLIDMPQDKILTYWLVAASYDRTDKEFEYLEAALRKLYPPHQDSDKRVVDPIEVSSPQVGPKRITISGVYDGDPHVKVVIRTKSAADEQTLSAEAPMAVGVCEAAQIMYTAYQRLQSRLIENRAPMCMAGSLEHDQGWYVDLLKNWSSPAIWQTQDRRSWVMTSKSNTFEFGSPEGKAELERIRADLTEDEYNRRHMGKPAPPRGLVFRDFNMEKHARTVLWEPETPVWLAIDPGIAGPSGGGSAYAIVACHLPSAGLPWRIFDCIYVDNLTEQVIIESILQNPSANHWKDREYWWGNSVSIQGVIDRAGATRVGAHEPSIEVWRKLARVNLLYTEAAIPIADQIRRFESFLRTDSRGEPGIVFDARCRGVLSELGGCENPLRPGTQDCIYRWNVAQDGTILGDRPRDRYNDAIKALTYLAVHQFGYATARNIPHVTRVRRYRDGLSGKRVKV